MVGIDELINDLENSEWFKFKPFAAAARDGGGDEEDGERPPAATSRNMNMMTGTLKNEFLDKKYGSHHFSFFQTSPVFFSDYERCKAKKLCFLCEKKEMELYNVPCGCLMWCISCGELSDYVDDRNKHIRGYVHQCIICNQEVEKLQRLSLSSSSSPSQDTRTMDETPVKTQASKRRGKQRREIKMKMKMEGEGGGGGGGGERKSMEALHAGMHISLLSALFVLCAFVVAILLLFVVVTNGGLFA